MLGTVQNAEDTQVDTIRSSFLKTIYGWAKLKL